MKKINNRHLILLFLSVLILISVYNTYQNHKLWQQLSPTISQQEYEEKLDDCKNTPEICEDIYASNRVDIRRLLSIIEDDIDSVQLGSDSGARSIDGINERLENIESQLDLIYKAVD